jgi:hypothetical protein
VKTSAIQGGGVLAGQPPRVLPRLDMFPPLP